MEKLERLTKDGKKLSEKTKAGTKTKVCSYCNKQKDRSEFITGRMCKSCKTKYDKERYLEKKTEIDSRMREYGKTEKGREVNRKASAQYRSTGKGAKNQAAWYNRTKADTEKYEEFKRQMRARNAVRNALKKGTLVKGVCEVCGSCDTEAHHDDYEKRLDVRWLCSLHHGVTRRLH